jgi:hypothetical protein
VYVTNVVTLKGFYMTTLTTKDSITQDEILKIIEDKWLLMIKEAVLAEREACAKVCDSEATIEGIAQRCSEAIRARGQHDSNS